MKRVFCAALCGLVLSGCATVGDPQAATVSVQVVESALTRPAAELRQAADQGDARAQLGYAIVLKYGLNGTKPDADAATGYRRLAVSSRGSTTTAIYVPDGKHSGHTQLISIPRYDISTASAIAVDECAEALSAQLKAEAVTGQCGGADSYAHLALLWSKARS